MRPGRGAGVHLFPESLQYAGCSGVVQRTDCRSVSGSRLPLVFRSSAGTEVSPQCDILWYR